MRFQVVQQTKNINLFLQDEELKGLTKKVEKSFYSSCIRASHKEGPEICLGYSSDPIFENIKGGNGVKLKQDEKKKNTYLINLSREGTTILRRNGWISVVYQDDNKIYITLK